MKRIIAMFSVMALLAATVVVMAMPAFAETVCTKERGTVTCTETETTSGKNEKQEKFQETTTTTTTTKGNQTNFSPEPQGTGTATAEECGQPCPPGQFK